MIEPLVDGFGRIHRSLRISVTDACNIRCQYCMPAESVRFLAKSKLLSFEHIADFARIAASCGIRKVRLTGGEPLLRPQLYKLIEKLRQIVELDEIALTTNGILLAEQIQQLVSAGLQRLNISLDTLSAKTFQQLSRRDGMQRILDGIEAARQQPLAMLKLNALVLRDVNFDDVIELIKYALERDLTIRFIEFMPLDGDRNWTANRLVRGSELRHYITQYFGSLQRVESEEASQPSVDYSLMEHHSRAKIGFIDSVSKPFCGTCDRVRLTADGKIRNCLFGREEWDVTESLKSRDFEAVERSLRSSLMAKHAAHGIDSPEFQPPERAMYQIGG